MRKHLLETWRRSNPATRKVIVAGGMVIFWLSAFALVGARLNDRPVEPEPSVTLSNFRRLHQGMTEEQVEAILGAGKKADDTLHPVMRYAGDGLEVEIRFYRETAIWGICDIHRLHEGMTEAQVEAILDEGRVPGGRWRWHRSPMPEGDGSRTHILFDSEFAVTGNLTTRGCWLREELRREPAGWASLLE